MSTIGGHGLFGAQPATLRFVPAPPNTGVVFTRVDLPRNPHEGVGLVDLAVRAFCEQRSAVPCCGRKRNE